MSEMSAASFLQRIVTARRVAFLHDIIVGISAFVLGFALRIDVRAMGSEVYDYLIAAGLFGLLVGCIGLTFGMNRGVWRYASLPDLLAIVKVASLSVVISIVAIFLLRPLEMVPRSSMAITWAFLILGLAGPRVLYRLYRDARDVRRFRIKNPFPRRRVLLLGASDDADLFLKTLSERSKSAFEVEAIIDERGRRAGRFIRGVPIVAYDGLPEMLEKLRARGRVPDALILARSRNDVEAHVPFSELVELSSDWKLELLRLPDMLDVHGLDSEIELQPVRLEDLLQRPPVELDAPRIAAMLEGRRVLITGAGGSIGSELARQIALFSPSVLILADASEFLLYSAEIELRDRFPQMHCIARLCNVREAPSVERLMEDLRPDVVFHAAALKHVPLVEAQPLEGLFTNAVGTRNVAEAAIRARVRAVVLVSTDKAVNPTNVMGAAKRMAEMFCQAMDLNPRENATRFMTVRFGNVLGSAGSVVPLFEKQLKAGGPLTVTHPEIERYFMTIPEACVLVLQSAAYGLANPTERGRLFVLDMGAPVKIADLARNLIRLSGLRPEADVKIVYTGLRPGEKMFEELFDRRETLVQTGVDGILMAFPRAIEPAIVTRIFDELARLIEARDLSAALRLLASTVPEFRPSEQMLRLMGVEPVLPLDGKDGREA